MAQISVNSTIPGIFFRKPGPGKPNYIEAGDTVEAGQILGLIEIMKQYSEVSAPEAGVLKDFHIDDGDMVMAGQEIATIETSAE